MLTRAVRPRFFPEEYLNVEEIAVEKHAFYRTNPFLWVGNGPKYLMYIRIQPCKIKA